jgi:hypothetical protein
MIKHVHIERASEPDFDPLRDMSEVIVELEDGFLWSASFATLPYLQRQMILSQQMTEGVRSLVPMRFAVLETPFVITDNLLADTIEDTIDNLMTLGTFESVFVLCEDRDFIAFGTGQHKIAKA